MKSIEPPETIKVYQLLKMTGTYLSGVSPPIPTSMSTNMGIGFYLTLEEAEHIRTLEILKDTTTGMKPTWHIFELEFPNPVLQK